MQDPKPKQIPIQLPSELRVQLEQRARSNERSIAAEIRLACRAWLAGKNSEQELATSR